MTFFQERRYWRRVLDSRIVRTFLVLAVLFLTFRVATVFWDVWQMRQELVKLGEQIKAAELRSQELAQTISKIREGSGIEQEARRRFNLKKEGEELIIVEDALPASKDESPGRPWGLPRWLKSLLAL